MKNEWKNTARVGIFAGLILLVIISPLFLFKDLPHKPFILIGYAALFPVAGFLSGRKAIAHPIWVSVILALVASLGIFLLGIATSESSSGDVSTVSGSQKLFIQLAMAKIIFEMCIQQTIVLIILSTIGGGISLYINQRKAKSSNHVA